MALVGVIGVPAGMIYNYLFNFDSKFRFLAQEKEEKKGKRQKSQEQYRQAHDRKRAQISRQKLEGLKERQSHAK